MGGDAGMGSGLFAPSPGTNLNYPTNLNQFATQPTPSPLGLPTALIQALMQSYQGQTTPDLLSSETPLAQMAMQGQLGKQELDQALQLGLGQQKIQASQVANMAPLYSGISNALGSIGNLFGGGGAATGAGGAAAMPPGAVGGSRYLLGSYAGSPSGGGTGSANGPPGSTGGGGGIFGNLLGGGGLSGLIGSLLGGSTGAPTGGGNTALGGIGTKLLTGFSSPNGQSATLGGGQVPGSPPLNGGWSGGRGPGPGGAYSFSGMPGGQGALAANAQAVPPAQRRMFNYAAGMGGTGGMMG